MCCLLLLPESTPVPAAFAELQSHGADIIRIPAPHRRYRQQYRSLLKALRARNIQLLHSHGYHADVLTRFCARALRLPHVSTLHGFVGATRRGRMYEALQLYALRSAAAVVAVSESVSQRAIQRGVSANRVHVITNAAPEFEVLSRQDARRVLGVPDTQQLLGWVGRMSSEKEPVAFAHLVARFAHDDSVAGVMLGDGPLMAEVQQVVVASDPPARLHTAGVVPAAGRLISAFDALIVTSSTEGTPMVVLEAMSAGVPVVSTAVGGVPQLLENGAGALVPYGDADGLYHAVRAVLADADYASRLSTAAQERVRTSYSRDAWWKRYRALYESVIA
jgi:glycosyltransferase involved in cell wall biosynthesis